MRVRASKGGDDLSTRNTLRGILEGNCHPASDRVFYFVAAFIDLSTRHECTALLTKVVRRYSECDLSKGEWHPARTKEVSALLDERVVAYKGMLVNIFDVRDDSGFINAQVLFP